MSLDDLVSQIIKFGEKTNQKKLRPYQVFRASQIIKALLVDTEKSSLTSLWARKCLSWDSLIYLPDGRCVFPESLKPGDTILSINSDGFLEEDEIEDIWTTNEKPALEIRSNYGLFLITSRNHLFKTPQGFREACSLVTLQESKVGFAQNQKQPKKQYLRGSAIFQHNAGTIASLKHGVFGTKTIGIEKAALLGYLLSDGNYAKGSIKFTNINDRLLQEAASFASLFGLKPKFYSKGNGYDIIFSCESKASELSPNALINWLKSLGIFGQKGENKTIPDLVFQLVEDEVAKFINRFYAGDGNVYVKKRSKFRKPAVNISCAAVSFRFALQLQALLFKFGIHSSIKPQGSIYIVSISDSESIKLFYKKIGPIFGKEKQSKNAYDLVCSFKRRFQLRYSFGNDLEWPSIQKIRSLPPQKMWDLRTKKNSNFIANGLSVHNSGKSELLKILMLSLMTLLPGLARTVLSKDFPKLKKYKDGINIAFAGPKQEIARIPFVRLKRQARQPSFLRSLYEFDVSVSVSNSNQFELSNGSTAIAFSGSETAANEGPEADVLLLDEASMLSAYSSYKILRPMIAASDGVLSQTGTPGKRKCPFLTDIEINKRKFPECHQSVPYTDVIPYSKAYANFIDKEIQRIPGGIDNRYFRMNYLLEWLIAEGHYVEAERFLSLNTAIRGNFKGRLAAGIDWGKVESQTCITVLEDCQDHVEVVDLLQVKGDYDSQFEIIIPFLRKYPFNYIFSEAVGTGDPLTDRLQKELGQSITVTPRFMSAPYKDLIFTNLITEISANPPRFFYFDDPSSECQSFIRQFLDAEQETKGNLLVVHKSDDEDSADDFLFSTALALDALVSNPATSIEYQTTGQKRDILSKLKDL